MTPSDVAFDIIELRGFPKRKGIELQGFQKAQGR